jgi:hypothetical protein
MTNCSPFGVTESRHFYSVRSDQRTPSRSTLCDIRSTSFEDVVHNLGQALSVTLDRPSEILLYPALRIASTEVDGPWTFLGVNKDVFSFGVSPNDAKFMKTCQGFRDLGGPVLSY